MNTEQIMQKAKEYEEQIVQDRRALHRFPEIGFDLQKTVSYVKNELTAMGYTPQDCGKAGVVALAGGKKPGRVFLLRADMDALPMAEESGESLFHRVTLISSSQACRPTLCILHPVTDLADCC